MIYSLLRGCPGDRRYVNGVSTLYVLHVSYFGIITVGGMSNNGKHHDNVTQSQEVPEDFPLWWPSEEHEEGHKTTSSKGNAL